MKSYTLSTPIDAHGQPIQPFRFCRENNAAKAIDQLYGLCLGILADGIVNEDEVRFFSEWVKKTAPLEPIWPFTEIIKRLDRIFADGQCDSEEREELKSIMESLCGKSTETNPGETYSTTFPLDTPLPDLVFPGRIFNITGKFAFGARKTVISAIEDRGGIAIATAPNRQSNYLVIGVFASRDWINTNHGRKIERGVELRNEGSGLAIVSEEHWKRFLV